MIQIFVDFFKALARPLLHLATEVDDFFSNVMRYYGNAQYRRADLRCHWAYLIRSPYTLLCRRRAIGVDICPVFVTRARAIKKQLGIEGVDFIYGNLLNLDYDDATVIYLYGTAFSDAGNCQGGGSF